MSFIDRLYALVSSVPLPTLYVLIGLASFVEGIFPPVPADVVVAFTAFLAARKGAELPFTVLATVVGTTLGAAVVYGVARRFGAAWMHYQLRRIHADAAERRLEGYYGRYGMGALFLSRFVPGLRAVVPPMAGMLRVPFLRAMGVMAVASAIWYSVIAALAFRVGEDWETLQFAVHRLVRRAGITALSALLLIALVIWATWRQRKFRKALEAEAATRSTPPEPPAPPAP